MHRDETGALNAGRHAGAVQQRLAYFLIEFEVMISVLAIHAAR
jgi:hypothetical protein